MSAPENELDLEKLFLPAWAQAPSSAKQYSQYEGREEQRSDRRPDRPGRPQLRRQGPPGARRDGGPPREERRQHPRGKDSRDRAVVGERRAPDRGEPRDRRERREPR